MNQVLRNYEIISVDARERVLITMDREELHGEWPVRIQGSRLEGGHLELSCESADGQAYNLRLLDFPEGEGSKLSNYRASLCGIENGRVAYAQTFPAPSRSLAPARGGP